MIKNQDFIYNLVNLMCELSIHKNKNLSQGWIDNYEAYTVADIINKISLFLNDYVNTLTEKDVMLYYYPNNQITDVVLEHYLESGYELMTFLKKEIDNGNIT